MIEQDDFPCDICLAPWSEHTGSGHPQPCQSYSGNLCGGFGGSLKCWNCGWDKYEHMSPQTRKALEKWIEDRTK